MRNEVTENEMAVVRSLTNAGASPAPRTDDDVREPGAEFVAAMLVVRGMIPRDSDDLTQVETPEIQRRWDQWRKYECEAGRQRGRSRSDRLELVADLLVAAGFDVRWGEGDEEDWPQWYALPAGEYRPCDGTEYFGFVNGGRGSATLAATELLIAYTVAEQMAQRPEALAAPS